MKIFSTWIIFQILIFWHIETVRGDSSTNNLSRSEFADIYFETSRLSEINTYVGYSQARAGFRLDDLKLETYAAARIGADSRTQLDSPGGIYNDNFAFAGVGLDYLGLLHGVRLTLQVGGSVDLSSKIHEGGPDLRTGFQSYHEIEWSKRTLFNEVYADTLYFKRYENILGSLQLRTVFNVMRWGTGRTQAELGTVVNLAAAYDTQGQNYNRTLELRFGPRWTLRGPVSLSIFPHYLFGTKWGEPASSPYKDIRILVSGFISI